MEQQVLAQSEEPVGDTTEEEMSMEQLRAQLKEEVLKKLGEQGCTEQMLEEWKGTYGPLGFQPIGDQIYVIRPLLRKEWKELNKAWNAKAQSEKGEQFTQFDTEEEITAKATLWPKFSLIDLKTSMPAGIATTLAEAVSNHAGFVPNASPIVF